jgi:uncharacterized protein DUF4336
MFRRLGENIWDHEMRILFGPIPLRHRMTVIRLADGGLLVHSPTRLDVAVQEEFRKLGPVVAIVAPSWWHDLCLREYLNAYPEARLYGAPTLVRWNRSLPFADVLDNSPPLQWQREIGQVHVQGIGLFRTRSRSIISLADRSWLLTCYSI